MKKRFNALPLVCWLLAIAATVAIYALLVDGLLSSPAKYASVCFVLLAELALCAKFTMGKHSIILNTNGVTGGIYLIATIILSIIYINVPSPNMKRFAVVHILLLAALVISDLTILNFEKRFSRGEETMAENRSLYVLAEEIVAENPNSEFKNKLVEISEALRYSDYTKTTGDENTLREELEDLREKIKLSENSEEICSKINKIITLVKTRNIQIKESQRGKI